MNDFADCSIHTPEFSLQGTQLWGRVVDIYDGDTMTVVIRAPSDKFHKFHVRIAGIDTAEIKGGSASAYDAKMRVVHMVTGRNDIDVIKHKRDMVKLLAEKVYLVELVCGSFDKYGRLLANVCTVDGVDIGSELLKGGLAHTYDGGKKEKFDS